MQSPFDAMESGSRRCNQSNGSARDEAERDRYKNEETQGLIGKGGREGGMEGTMDGGTRVRRRERQTGRQTDRQIQRQTEIGDRDR